MGKSSVTIKSFRHGFDVVLSPDAQMELIEEELGRRFSENREFFGAAKKAVSFSGRILTDEEEDRLIDVIRENSDIDIDCVVEKDDTRDTIYLRALEEVKDAIARAGNQVYVGTVRSGEVIESEYGVVVLGDVNPGASVISGGSVVILGTLYGSAEAGYMEEGDAPSPGDDDLVSDDDTERSRRIFVAALRMKPEEIFVNGYRANVGGPEFRTGLLSKKDARIVYERDGRVYTDSITPEFLSSL